MALVPLPLSHVPVAFDVEVDPISLLNVVDPLPHIQLPGVIIHQPIPMLHVAEPGALVPVFVRVDILPFAGPLFLVVLSGVHAAIAIQLRILGCRISHF